MACRNSTATPGGLEGSARPTAGYNYYEYQSSTIRRLRTGEPMSFYMTDRSLRENNPSDDLRSFARLLLTLWSLGGLGSGC